MIVGYSSNGLPVNRLPFYARSYRRSNSASDPGFNKRRWWRWFENKEIKRVNDWMVWKRDFVSKGQEERWCFDALAGTYGRRIALLYGMFLMTGVLTLFQGWVSSSNHHITYCLDIALYVWVDHPSPPLLLSRAMLTLQSPHICNAAYNPEWMRSCLKVLL